MSRNLMYSNFCHVLRICKQNGVKYRAATEDTTFSTDYYFAESYLVLIPVDNNGKMSAPVTSELLTTSAK